MAGSTSGVPSVVKDKVVGEPPTVRESIQAKALHHHHQLMQV